MIKLRLSLTLCLLLLAGCRVAPQQAGQPTPAPTSTPTSLAHLPLIVQGVTPPPTATPTVTATPRPTETLPPTTTPVAGFDPARTTIALEGFLTGLNNPVGVTHAGDGSGRLFVVEKTGRVRVVKAGRLLEQPFLNLSGQVSTGYEQGLLGLAFHPRYRENGLFYVNYTDRAGDTMIVGYRVSDNPDVADAGSATPILSVDQPHANHNGGHLAFGPDGYLYIGLGDGGSGGDPQNRAQTLSDLLGKMLRINVNSGEPYSVPPDNPFVGRTDARPEIWAYGLRNPWRYAFDRETGDVYTGDVGQGAWEEIDYQPAGSRGGENYGWRIMEGAHCYPPNTTCDTAGLTLPIAEYGRNEGGSVTGGVVYRGRAYPALWGAYFFADFSTGRTWALSRDAGGGWVRTPLLDTDIAISSFGEDEQGEVYLTGLYDGRVYRVVAAPRS